MIVTSLNVLARLDVIDCRIVLYHVCDREPSLTTIRQPRGDLGAAGAERCLIPFGGEPCATESPIVPHGELLARDITGPAQQSNANDGEFQSAGLEVRQGSARKSKEPRIDRVSPIKLGTKPMVGAAVGGCTLAALIVRRLARQAVAVPQSV
jgi:hypothetical protein